MTVRVEVKAGLRIGVASKEDQFPHGRVDSLLAVQILGWGREVITRPKGCWRSA